MPEHDFPPSPLPCWPALTLYITIWARARSSHHSAICFCETAVTQYDGVNHFAYFVAYLESFRAFKKIFTEAADVEEAALLAHLFIWARFSVRSYHTSQTNQVSGLKRARGLHGSPSVIAL